MAAVYIAGVDLEWLGTALSASGEPWGSRLIIIDTSGAVVASYPHRESFAGGSASGIPLAQLAVQRGEGVAEVAGLDSEPLVVAFTPFLEHVSGTLYLVVGVPKEAIDGPGRRHFWLSLGVSSALCLVMMALIYWAGERLFVRRLAALDGVVEAFRRGDHRARSGLRYTGDEIGRLALSFDTMAQVLDDRERDLAGVTRTLRVLSSGNRAMLQATSEKALVEAMCQILVDTGGYRLACIGYVDDGAQAKVRLAACAGPDPALGEHWQALWDERHPEGVTWHAIRERRPVATRYISQQTGLPWRRSVAQRFNYDSIVAIPLQASRTILGVLIICAQQPEAFNDEEMETLTEFAADLAYGISTQRQRAVRERLEASLTSMQEQLTAVAEASLDVLLILKTITDDTGAVAGFEITHANRRAEEVLGLARSELVGRTLAEDFTYANAAMFREYAAVYVEQEAKDVEFAAGAVGAGRRWIRQQIVPMRVGVAVFSRDVTEEKEASERISDSEARLRSALAAGRMGAWTWDIATDALLLSDGAAALFGLPAGEARTSVEALFQRVDAADQPALAAAILHLREQGGRVNAQFRVPWPDGILHWLEVHSEGLADASGRTVRAAGVVVDVTGYKESLRALGKANRKLTLLSGITERLVRSHTETELLQGACEVLAGDANTSLVGIGFAHHDAGRTITPVALAGEQKSLDDWLAYTWQDTETGQRPISRAIRSGQPQVENDIPNAPAFAAWAQAPGKPDFLSNLAIPLFIGGKIIGALSLYAGERNAYDAEEVALFEEVGQKITYALAFLRTAAERDAIAYQHEHHAEILRQALEQTIEAVSATIEMRDAYTAGHQRRVADLAVAIARDMGLPEDRIEGLRFAAYVHDVGKITIPAEILSKPAKLSHVERLLVQAHPQAGHDILRDVKFPWPIADIILQHHERLDGSGYPRGLKGHELLLESRILAVADTVEAMASHRPYRASLGLDAALDHVEQDQGRRLDADAVRCCLALFREHRFSFETRRD